MSMNNINPGSPLARALDAYAVPGLPAGFAERVMAAAEARPATLPALRRPRRAWRIGQRFAVGIASFGLLASAAAATGMLGGFDIPVPSASKVWAHIAGQPAIPAQASTPAIVAAAQNPVPASEAVPTVVAILGPVDTPEELAEVFRRIEDVRQGRFAARRARIDERIDSAIDRRRAAGLPLPTPEQEARLRERIESGQLRREQIVRDRLDVRRAEMEDRIESGQALTRKDIIEPLRQDARAIRRDALIERLQRMAPEQRREALRRLPPAERRALMEQYRARRTEEPVPEPLAAPVFPPDTPPAQEPAPEG